MNAATLPKRLRQSIFWLNKPDHFAALPDWLAARGQFDTILRVTHDDTGAVSFWLFLEKKRRGIVRCLTPDLADAAEEFLPFTPTDHIEGAP